MDLQAQSLSKSLRHHFKIQNVPLSVSGSISEAISIIAVLEGYRSGCLLSTCTASKGALIALQDALQGSYREAQFAIAVHRASQQIFFLNVDLLLRQFKEEQGPLLYYAIDVDIEETERCQLYPPEGLQNHQISLCSTLISTAGSDVDVPVYLLGSEEESALEGIALAGWLLGYHVVYFFQQIPSSPSRCQYWSRDDPFESQSWSQSEMTTNCLASIPLVLIKVNTPDGLCLFQYTFPASITKQISDVLTVRNSMANIAEAIQQRIFHNQTAHSIQVTHEIVTKDRIAL